MQRPRNGRGNGHRKQQSRELAAYLDLRHDQRRKHAYADQCDNAGDTECESEREF